VQGQLGQLVQLTCLMEYHEYISKLRFFPQYVIVLSLKSIVDHSVIVCRWCVPVLSSIAQMAVTL